VATSRWATQVTVKTSIKGISRLARRASRFLAASRPTHPVVSLVLLIVVINSASEGFKRCEQIARDLNRATATFQRFIPIPPTLHHSQQIIAAGSQGYRNPTIVYPDILIPIFKKAHRDKRDILGSFEALDRDWRAGSPRHLLTIRFAHPASTSPSIEEGQFASWTDCSEQVEKGNFEQMLPILMDIRDLIVGTDGDGSGRGRLLHSGYPAEPVAIGSSPGVESSDAR
jgi:hypothetical protein